ncbi:hypothetical protein JOC37_001808 [Desulfohalotomaculum tongense]|nr:hypothetical protein [Desulforadius tongensis]
MYTYIKELEIYAGLFYYIKMYKVPAFSVRQRDVLIKFNNKKGYLQLKEKKQLSDNFIKVVKNYLLKQKDFKVNVQNGHERLLMRR